MKKTEIRKGAQGEERLKRRKKERNERKRKKHRFIPRERLFQRTRGSES